MKSIKGIIFDADNTLYSTKEFAKEADMAAMELAAQASGKNPEELYKLWAEIVSILKNSSEPKKRTRNYSYSELLKKISAADSRLDDRMAEAFEKKVLENISLKPGVRETLEALKKDFRLFIITDEHRFVFEKKLDKLGLEKFFELIITSDDIGVMKPSEKFYSELKKLSGLEYENLLAVGDSFEKDLEIPKSLGMKTVLFGSQNTSVDFCIKNISELEGVSNAK